MCVYTLSRFQQRSLREATSPSTPRALRLSSRSASKSLGMRLKIIQENSMFSYIITSLDYSLYEHQKWTICLMVVHFLFKEKPKVLKISTTHHFQVYWIVHYSVSNSMICEKSSPFLVISHVRCLEVLKLIVILKPESARNSLPWKTKENSRTF